MTIHYVGEVTGNKWVEYGERIVPGRDPVRFFEMTLTRVGDTEWLAGNAIPVRADGAGATQ